MAEPVLTKAADGRWLLQGELSSASVPAILKSSTRDFKASREIKVDLKRVTRADSAGLVLLVEWLRESERVGKVNKLCQCAGAAIGNCKALRRRRYSFFLNTHSGSAYTPPPGHAVFTSGSVGVALAVVWRGRMSVFSALAITLGDYSNDR